MSQYKPLNSAWYFGPKNMVEKATKSKALGEQTAMLHNDALSSAAHLLPESHDTAVNFCQMKTFDTIFCFVSKIKMLIINFKSYLHLQTPQRILKFQTISHNSPDTETKTRQTSLGFLKSKASIKSNSDPISFQFTLPSENL